MKTHSKMTQRILSILLTLLMVLSLIPTSVMAADTDQPWLDSSVTATMDGITLYIPEVYCDDCGENVQDAELVIDSVDYAVGTLTVKYHLGRHLCFEISTKSNTIRIDDFDCTMEYNEYPVYANAWDQTTSEPVAYLSREAGHVFDEGESGICAFCGEMVQTGWVYDSGNWYYYYEDGTMATDTIISNEYGSYYVGSDGVMVVNQKVMVDDVWYQAKEDGTLEPLGFDNRWELDSNNWYYYYEDGTMATDIVISNENGSYYFGSDGALVVNQKVLVDGVWYQAAEDGRLEPLETDTHNYVNGICSDCGEYLPATDENEDGVFEISNAGQLYWFAEFVNAGNTSANAILTADIVVNEGVMDKNSTDVRVWTPIGNKSKPYTGIFDGNNKTISGLYVNDENKQNIGLFGYVGTGCEIKNIGIINSYFNALLFVGGIVGYAQGVTITNCYNTSFVNGQNYAGGVAGYAEESTVANCYNTGVVDGTDGIGGMIGWRLNLTIVNCYYLNTSCYIGIGNGSDSEGSLEAKTAEAFASGEVAYLLQGEQEEEIWGQKIGTETAPVFGGDKVYYGYTSCADGATAVYTNNSSAPADKPDHNFVNGFCTVCDIFEPATDENEDGVYEIANAGQLYWFADKVNNDNANFRSASAVLTDDIVVNEGVMSAESTDVRVWTPIGNTGYMYTGTFDGNNKTVSGLYFNNTDTEYVGLFGRTGENGTVKNTGVINSYFNGYNSVGGVVGSNHGKITNCYNTGDVSGNNYVGGLVGDNPSGTIIDCYNTGDVSGNNYVGGLVGYNPSGTIIDCYNTGDVSGAHDTGGLVGYNPGGTIANCYNTGAVSGTEDIGGLVGYNSRGTIANCYNTGAVSGTEYIGGLVGYNPGGTITNCYYLDTACTGGINGADAVGSAEAKTAEQFKSGEVAYLLQGTQEEEIWGQKIGTEDYPLLGSDKVYKIKNCKGEATYSNTNEDIDHNFEGGFCIGCGAYEPCPGSGTAAEPYMISNAGQLYWFAAVVNEGYGAVAQNAEVHAKLMADIIVNEGPLTYNTADARVWIPIGKCQSASYGGPGEGVAFKGTFDGNGFTISGLYHPYSKEMYDYAGFIGCLQGDNSQVRDLGIINCFIDSRYIAAGIVGTNDGGTVENCYVTGTISTGAHGAGIAGKNTGTVTECYNDALISGLSFGGGIVAFNEGTVSKCYNIGDCRFDTGGGIAYQSTGLVEECYNVVDLSFSRHGAGIVWNGNGEVIRCYNTGNISSPLFKVCGVAGVADKIIDCYNTGDVSGDTAFGVGSSYTLVKNCYNTGRITAKSYAVGACPTDGIVTSENCYYLEGMVTSEGTVDVDVQGESEAKSAEAFTSGEVAYLLQNNREEQIWGQKLGEENTPQFSENKVYKNQIGGCKEVNFVYEYSNTQEDAVTTHPGEWIIDASWSPESSESCYVYIDVYCTDCGDYLDSTSCEAELISEEAPINCQNPGKREWSCTFTVSDRTFTETYTEVLRNDVHTDLNDDGFCTACGGYEKPEVDPGEDPEWDYDDVYLIYNAGQLYWFAEHVNNVNNGICGKLMADIDLNPGFTFKSDGSYSFGGIEGPFGGEIIGLEPPRMWTPIGSGALCYAGNFDGNGFVVSGAYAVSENYYVGLFGNTDYNYEIKNLGISNSYFEGSAYVGGLVGYAYTYIQNCYVTDTVYVNGGSNTAALVGYNGVEIWNSYAMSDTLTDGGWGSLYNCYYLADEEIHNEDGLTFKTAEQFESGEVAYLLQAAQVGEPMVDDDGYYIYDEDGNLVYDTENVPHVWGQKIGEDTYPVFGGDKVYAVKNCIDEVAGYSNTEGEILDHIDYENGFCTLCGEYQPATLNEDGVYEIGNAGQLYWFAEYVNAGNVSANAILTADIVVNEGTVTESSTDARVWTPIGIETCQFAGTVNGNGKTISGLYFNDDVIYVGLFGCVMRATVKDLGVINSYLNGKYFVGGVVGYNYNGTIINCYNTSTVSGMSDVGGVAGFNYCGGTVSGGIFNCYNTGKVLSTHTDMVVTGGVLGNNQGAIINNCYYLDTSCTGGIYGEDVEGSAEAKTAEQFASGEVAYLLQGEQTEEIWGQKIGTDELPTLGGDKVYAVKNCIDEVVSYNNTEEKILDHDFENGFCTLCGDFEPATDENNDGVYEIGNAGQLYWFAEYVNAGNVSANAILTADIVVNEGTVTESSTDARVWTPIGNWSNKYTGTFDGNDYTVSGLYFNDSEVQYVGLFGVIGENGAVKNTGVINSYFNADECVGGVSGYNFGTVTNCYSTAKISADRFAGGIVGCSYGIVANSYNTGKVNGNNSVSGVVGVSQYGTIINCYNTGEVSGTNNVGGILGESYSATIANCYNTGTVEGNHYFGAIFGYGRNYDASNCYYLDSSCSFGTGDDSVYGPITSIAKTSGAFASGEVAYLLGDAFGQKIGTDELPTIGGDKVYYGYLSCADDATAEYTNNSNAVAEKGHNFVNGFCVFCDVFEPATLNNDGVYEIGNAGQLYWFADKVNNDNANFGSANAILTADIVVNEGVMTAESTDARVWTPIGNDSNEYTGTFDGNNKTVSGLYINDSETDYIGLFGFVGENGAVNNTGVINSYFNGYCYVGGVVGYNNGKMTNCYNTGTVSGEKYVGGVLGENYYGTIINSYNAGSVSGTDYVGGLVGSNARGTIDNSYNAGSVSGTDRVGGLVGFNTSGATIGNCYNEGSVSGTDYVGGMVGSNNGTIANCYNTGEVSGTYYIGGVVGNIAIGTIENCYNTGEVSGSDIGGVVGYRSNGTITNCYYLDTACRGGINGADEAGSAEAKTAEQFASGEVAYLLGDAFGQKIGTDQLPTLGGDKVYQVENCIGDPVYSNANENIDHNFVNGFCTVCDVFEPATLNNDGVYEIGNAGQLYWFADKVNNDNANFGSANAILTANIVVNEGTMSAESEGARAWTPIGSYDNNYTGTFDGNGKTVSGLYFNNTVTEYVGLFGCIGKNGAVKNTGVINSYFNGYLYVGGVAGVNNAGTITNCYNTGVVSGENYIGGVVGYNDYYGAITNCYNTGELSGENYIGGVVGYTPNGAITNCYNTGKVSGDFSIGGVVGYNDYYGKITNCYNTGEVSGNYCIGGVVGYTPNGKITNCYNTGEVSGSEVVGGVVGRYLDGTITNCYYINTACSGGIDGADVAGSAEAKTAEAFANGEVAYLLQGEQEELVWGQKIGIDELPTLGGDKVYAVTKCNGEVVSCNNTEGEILDHNFEDGFCTICGDMDGIAQVKGYSISLGGNIAVNYYMLLSDEVLADENAEMVFTVPDTGSTYEVRIPVSSVTPDANGYYVFTCEVAAKEMASKIAAQIVTSDKESDVFEYSVKQYAEYILAKAEEANNLVGGGVAGGIAGGGVSNLLTPEMLSYVSAAPLVKAMLNYGAYAQVYFDYNTDILANDSQYISAEDKVLPDSIDLSSYKLTFAGEEEGVSFYGAALSLKSETAIKLYFRVEGDASLLDVTVNGEAYTLTKNGNLYELKISDIPAHLLTKMYEVKVGGITITYGAMSYADMALSTGKSELKNAVKALWLYAQAASDYITASDA